MNSQWLTIKQEDNKEFSGYLSLPPTGKGPGLILLQEIWGVNDHIKALADQYALSGYVVLAPDVFWRLDHRVDLAYDAAGSQKAFGYYNNVDVETAATDLNDAVKVLRSQAAVTDKVGVVGYCLGGQLAYRTAAISHVDAAVCYYGGGIDQCLDLAGQISAPILFHYANDDEHISQQAVQGVKQAFVDNADANFFDYPNTGHGFNCWGRQAMYNQPASALAQGRTLVFLAEHL